jgi:hypothetical protein
MKMYTAGTKLIIGIGNSEAEIIPPSSIPLANILIDE